MNNLQDTVDKYEGMGLPYLQKMQQTSPKLLMGIALENLASTMQASDNDKLLANAPEEQPVLDRKIAGLLGTPAKSPGIALNDSRMQAQQMQQQMQGMPPQMAAAGGLVGLPSPNMARMAGGGIVSFQKGGEVDAANEYIRLSEKLKDPNISPEAAQTISMMLEDMKRQAQDESRFMLEIQRARDPSYDPATEYEQSMQSQGGMYGGGIVGYAPGGEVEGDSWWRKLLKYNPVTAPIYAAVADSPEERQAEQNAALAEANQQRLEDLRVEGNVYVGRHTETGEQITLRDAERMRENGQGDLIGPPDSVLEGVDRATGNILTRTIGERASDALLDTEDFEQLVDEVREKRLNFDEDDTLFSAAGKTFASAAEVAGKSFFPTVYDVLTAGYGVGEEFFGEKGMDIPRALNFQTEEEQRQSDLLNMLRQEANAEILAEDGPALNPNAIGAQPFAVNPETITDAVTDLAGTAMNRIKGVTEEGAVADFINAANEKYRAEEREAEEREFQENANLATTGDRSGEMGSVMTTTPMAGDIDKYGVSAYDRMLAKQGNGGNGGNGNNAPKEDGFNWDGLLELISDTGRRVAGASAGTEGSTYLARLGEEEAVEAERQGRMSLLEREYGLRRAISLQDNLADALPLLQQQATLLAEQERDTIEKEYGSAWFGKKFDKEGAETAIQLRAEKILEQLLTDFKANLSPSAQAPGAAPGTGDGFADDMTITP